MNKKLVLGAVLMSGLSFNSMAAMDRGWYVGGGFGTTEMTSESDSGTTQDPSFDEKGHTLRAMAGFKFNRIASIEFQYADYGEIKQKGSANESTLEPTAISIAGNIGYTFDNGIRPFGIIGLTHIDLGVDQPGFDDKGDAVRIGFGLEYVNPRMNGMSFRLGYEADMFDVVVTERDNRTLITTQTTNSVTLGSAYAGVSYHF